MLALTCLVAALAAALFDLHRGSTAARLLLLGGALALASPAVIAAWVPPARDRLSPPTTAPGRASRAAPMLAGAALAAPAAVLAVARIGGSFPAPAAWALPAILVTAAIVAVVPVVAARRVEAVAAGERLWIPVAFTSALGAVLFVVVHIGAETLLAIRPGTGMLHVALFVGTLVVTALGAWILGLSADDAWVAALPRRRGVLAGALALALGAGCLFADRRAFVDLYAHVHAWLSVVGVVSVAAGAAFLAPLGLRRSAFAHRLAGTAVVAVATLLVVVFGRGARPALRAELNAAPVGKTLLAALGASKAERAPITSHPLLAVDQMLREPGPPGQLNLLLITVDALRDDRLDAGYSSLDQLANESVRFRRAYTQGTRTPVAVGALMRGVYSANIDWRLMIYRGGRLQDPKHLSKARKKAMGDKFVYTTVPSADGPPMLAERIRKKGLRTMVTAYAGTNEFFRRGGAYDRGWDAFEDMTEEEWEPPTSDNVVTKALAQIADAGERRWFQWIHLYDPHEAKGKTPGYDGYVRAFDKALGRLMSELRARGLWDRTIVVLSADHGEALGEHGHRGHASSLYEEQARVPLLIRVPGAARRTFDEPVALIDVSATLAVAAGADTTGFDGVNLWPAFFSGRYPARRPVFLELHRYHSSSNERTADLKGVVLDDHKLVLDRLRGTEQLFSLKADPREGTSILTQQPDRAEELRAVLGAFLSRAEAAHPLP